jgi:hypothetical protein
MQMAIDEVNAKGGVLGRKFEMVVADETENPETGINAVKKLTGDDKVDVLVGGCTSGVTLAQLPHISRERPREPRRVSRRVESQMEPPFVLSVAALAAESKDPKSKDASTLP